MSFLQNYQQMPMEGIEFYSNCSLCNSIIFESEEEIYYQILTTKHSLLLQGFCCFCIEFLVQSRFFLSRLNDFLRLISFIERVYLEYRIRNNLHIVRYPALLRFLCTPSIGNFRVVVNQNLLNRKYSLTLKWIKLLNSNKIYIKKTTCLHHIDKVHENIFWNRFYLSHI
jgi:hypothetical protein